MGARKEFAPKGQLISKADWRAIDSPKKRTDEFVLFAFLLFMANKSNSSVHFLGESRPTNLLFGFILPLLYARPFDGEKLTIIRTGTKLVHNQFSGLEL